MIKAIVFDFDGLIIDTESAWYHAYSQVFIKHQAELPLHMFLQSVGTTNDVFNPDDYLEECLGRKLNRSELSKLRRGHYDQYMAGQKLRDGVLDYLQTAKQIGLNIGLASSSGREWVEDYLKQLDIFDYFDSIHTRDDVQNVKPDPELYLRAIHHLGVQSTEAIAFEDSAHGAHAAQKAGLYCVWVPNSITTYLAPNQFDLRLESMAERDLEDVIEMIEFMNSITEDVKA